MKAGAGILSGPSLLDMADEGGARVAMMAAGAKATRTYPAFQKWAIDTTALRAAMSAEERAEVFAIAEAHRIELRTVEALAAIAAAQTEDAVRAVRAEWLGELRAWPYEAAAPVFAAARRRIDEIIGIEPEDV